MRGLCEGDDELAAMESENQLRKRRNKRCCLLGRTLRCAAFRRAALRCDAMRPDATQCDAMRRDAII